MILFEKDFREEQKEPIAYIDKERRLETLLYNCKIIALEAEAKIVITKEFNSYEITLTANRIDKIFFGDVYADMISNIIQCSDSIFVLPQIQTQGDIMVKILYSIEQEDWECDYN